MSIWLHVILRLENLAPPLGVGGGNEGKKVAPETDERWGLHKI